MIKKSSHCGRCPTPWLPLGPARTTKGQSTPQTLQLTLSHITTIMSVPTTNDAGAAQRLKAEADALFRAKDYQGAFERYTEAIRHSGGKNPILYCNRSACSRALGRRLEATDDAQTAITLDPSYAKAYARLAAANTGTLTSQGRAIEALQKALSILPPVDSATPLEKRQRAEYAALLDAAEKEEKKLNEDVITRAKCAQELMGVDRSRLPWALAAEVIPTLKGPDRWNSSAWLIRHARQEWQKGMDIMQYLRTTEDRENDQYTVVSPPGAVLALSNAVLTDYRAFKFLLEGDPLGVFVSQLRVELSANDGWYTGGSHRVISEADLRRQSEPLDDVLYSLTITIRGWIVNGWLEETYMGALEHSLDYYTSALEVLNWARKVWEDEDPYTLGPLFQEHVVHVVKCLQLRVYTQLYEERPGPGSQSILEHIRDGAQELLDELLQIEHDAPPEDSESCYPLFLAYMRYPLAQAHAFQGFYYHQTGILMKEAAGGINTDEVADMYISAAHSYEDAASFYPQDDEMHIWSLYRAFHISLDVGREAGDLLDILDKVHNAMPKMKTVWEVPLETCVCLREGAFETCATWREELLSSLEHGKLTRSLTIMRGPSEM
ncbi:hypothetical protein C8Q77DRAFT_1078840 [Trametes polyzona]|nr:hypothetical protein C8Q77DRAFT_1078840 [Trametes polyzona]